jgi:hypothetical protein
MKASSSAVAGGSERSPHRARPRTGEERTRRCLGCQRAFHSSGPANRICPQCRSHHLDNPVGARVWRS